MDDLQETLLAQLVKRQQSLYFGKYRGTVKEVDAATGAVKAEVVDVYGQGRKSPWAQPAVPFAGPKHGLVFLPEAEDGVWIEFEAGNISKPIWTGCWWADNEMPGGAGEKQRVIATSKDLKIILDDDAKTITLQHPGGAEIKLDDNGITLTMGSSKLELTSTGLKVNDGAMEVK